MWNKMFYEAEIEAPERWSAPAPEGHIKMLFKPDLTQLVTAFHSPYPQRLHAFFQRNAGDFQRLPAF